jgi:hypothetical protein
MKSAISPLLAEKRRVKLIRWDTPYIDAIIIIMKNKKENMKKHSNYSHKTIGFIW